MQTKDEAGDTGQFASDTYRFDVAADERPSEAVVTAVAAATGRPVVPSDHRSGDDGEPALPALQEHVDADALDALLGSRNGAASNCEVTFVYGGCTVTVRPDAVTVRRRS